MSTTASEASTVRLTCSGCGLAKVSSSFAESELSLGPQRACAMCVLLREDQEIVQETRHRLAQVDRALEWCQKLPESTRPADLDEMTSKSSRANQEWAEFDSARGAYLASEQPSGDTAVDIQNMFKKITYTLLPEMEGQCATERHSYAHASWEMRCAAQRQPQRIVIPLTHTLCGLRMDV